MTDVDTDERTYSLEELTGSARKAALEAVANRLNAGYDVARHLWDLVHSYAKRIEVHLREKVKEISRKLEADGYAQLEYERSEENCLLHASEHNLRFTEDGELVD